ncbi:hypothetical protein CHS0354_029936 [Potamilus streckersoni]|uniref:V-type proton ATPase subunit S1 n=1 Tax=Potamilus streckersoni TaxID=2493646 RepID=A0AAE0VIP5_9BIVA|nr:hypothetical protein CHS0354_029936 [Potamilus streckersoni]
MKGIIILLLFFTSSLAENTPVLIWSPSSSLRDLPPSFLGGIINADDFSSKYLSPLSSNQQHNLIVFLQDKLSLEDFTNHADVYNPDGDGGAFRNIKNQMDTHSSIHLPAVKMPAKAIYTLMNSLKDKVHQVKDIADMQQLDLASEQDGHMILVSLKPVLGKDEARALSENDKMIAAILAEADKKGIKYTAMYTADSSSEAPQVNLIKRSVDRHLLEAVDNSSINGTFYNGTCIYLYMRQINISVITNDTALTVQPSLPPGIQNATNFSFCNYSIGGNETYSGYITLNLQDNGTAGNRTGVNLDVALKLSFNLNNTYDWQVKEADINITGSVNKTNVNWSSRLNFESVVVPLTFSYHCSSAGPYATYKQNNTSPNNLTVEMYITGFQVQAFNITMYKFGDGWDCIGFFTTGIWMGIFSAVILLMILFFGVNMIANIKTFDRFDDPKGKTITVNVNE